MFFVSKRVFKAVAIAVWGFTASVIAAPYVAPAQAASVDIVETARASDQFQTLLKLLDAAGMVDTLKSAGPFTVFAPTDQAFADLPEGVVDELLMPENKDLLVQVLDYHVVPRKVLAGDIDGADDLKSVEGGWLSIEVGEQFWVDEAVVTKRDIEASNGVIHAIDKVVLPRDVAL